MPGYLGIPREKMRLVPLGINLDGYSPRPQARQEPFTIGYLARIAPEKGLHVLADAYRRLRTRPGIGASRFVAAGYLAPEHRAYLDGIVRDLNAWGIESQFEYRGEVDRTQKIEFLRSLDVFSVPATYEEPKGLFLLEAMASGVPVVQPRRGAFPEVVETTGGGIIVDADNPEALADGFLELWRDPARATAAGAAGAAGVRNTTVSIEWPRRPKRLFTAEALRRRTCPRNRRTTMLSAEHLSKSYATPRGPLPILIGRLADAQSRRCRRDHGPVGQRQEHAALYSRRARHTVDRHADIDGKDPFALGDREQAAFRNRSIGFVFQDHSLLPQCSVLENVLAPTLVASTAGPARTTINRGRANSWPRLASAIASIIARRSCPEARSNAPPSHAP